MDQSSAAEQRAFAVAKLKRAASLPRMKDGRRPPMPMHVEAVSEGERSLGLYGNDDENTPTPEEHIPADIDDPPLEQQQQQQQDQELDQEQIHVHDPEPHHELEHEPEPEPEHEHEPEPEPEPEQPDPAPRSKRRSRSRSRSRGSKDLKGKQRPVLSPTHSPLAPANDSSPEESPPPPPPAHIPATPPLVSPIPSHAELQRSRLLMSPAPTSPELSLFYPGTSPPTPMLPSLEALQKGVFRSNSAAARMMAMHKLTGGTETYDHPFSSPSPTPPLERLVRNNTVSGGERLAARKIMLRRLGERIKEVDAEQTSGGEDIVVPTPPKRRRRRSRRSSAGNTAISDSDFVPTSPNTPQVPPTPLPISFDSIPDPPPNRASSATPSQNIPSQIDDSHQPAQQQEQLQQQEQEQQHQQENRLGESPSEHGLTRRRSILVEEDDIPDENLPPFSGLPSTPQRLHAQVAALRVPHGSDAPSTTSTDSTSPTAIGVPVYFSATGTPPRSDLFPTSPFTTPLKERPSGDDEEEQVLYQAENHQQRAQYRDAFDREISWVADPVPVSRIPIHDDDVDDEEYDEDPPLSATSSKGGFSPRAFNDASPRASSDSKESVTESEMSPEVTPSYVPPSPSSVAALSHTASLTRASDDSASSQLYPARLSVASRMQSDRSPLSADFTDWEDSRAVVIESSASKRTADGSSGGGGGGSGSGGGGGGGSTSTWEKVKNTFTRSASSNGRRSRTNSIVTRERRDHTDSSISHESGASLTSAKTDKCDSSSMAIFAHQQVQQPLMQSPSASASILSLAPRGGVSPVPPGSTADLGKYQNAKLFPFPGIKKLEEQRNRAKGITQSASSPDVTVLHPDGDQRTQGSSSSGNTPAQTPEMTRDRRLSHQASDSRLLAKFNSPPLSAAPSSSSHVDYFGSPPSSPLPPAQTATTTTSTSTGSLNLKLPMNREGVKKWLSAKKLFSSQVSPSSSSSTVEPRSPPPQNANKKPSLSDLLRGRKENELAAEWEEFGSNSEKPRTMAMTPTTTTTTTTAAVPVVPASASSSSGATVLAKPSFPQQEVIEIVRTVTPNNRPNQAVPAEIPDTEKTPKAKKMSPPVELNGEADQHSEQLQQQQQQHQLQQPQPPTAMSTPPELPSSTTPDPLSSLEDYPPHSTSESSSTTSSQYSQLPIRSQGAIVLERLDEMLGRGQRSPMWAAVIDDPPRKLLLSSPVLQVVNSNTVKDRFLFLFSDLLVIAKPIMQDQDNILDAAKPNPLDRKFIVKSVVMLRQLRFSGDREEPPAKTGNYTTAPRSPLIRAFIHQFSKDPDRAIASLFEKAGARDDSVALGQLLFRTLELDRARLGDYLSRRTSKLVLKAFVGEFGFTDLRVDQALRVFLLSINVPSYAVEYLLDAFASRWYEANAGIVAYDKDLAIRLVRALVQLNNVMHGGISQEPGPTGYPRRNISSRDFLEAFRRCDARCLVSDQLLEDVYNSIRREKLFQARDPASPGPPDICITIKRTLPPRLTYRVQSEPIILRIPQPDPELFIQLYGQELVFDPPVLSFVKSSEASFRVTGISLGAKTMIMCRSGPHALRYSGLPLSSSVVVERAFMRNTFQVAFPNQAGVKRRYMFSVDDPLIRHQWTVSLKRQIDSTSSLTVPSLGSMTPGASKFYPAAESTAFKVLQETLLGPEAFYTRPPPSAIDKALLRLTSPRQSSNGNYYSSIAEQRRSSGTARNGRLNGTVPSHMRSKSRSQVYHRHGAGRMEPESSINEHDVCDPVEEEENDTPHERDVEQPSRLEGRLWSGRDLEMQCQQNSSIALVLAYLQIGAPDHDHGGS